MPLELPAFPSPELLFTDPLRWQIALDTFVSGARAVLDQRKRTGESKVSPIYTPQRSFAEALKLLTKKQKTIFMLRAGGEATWDFIAKEVNTSRENARGLFKTARKRLQALVLERPESAPSLPSPSLPRSRSFGNEFSEYQFGLKGYNLLLGTSELVKVPESSGCYAFVDSHSREVLRVGQSKCLWGRLCWYLFSPKDRVSRALWEYMNESEPRYDAIRIAIWLTSDLDFTERRLLEEFRPRFNVVGGRFLRERRK